MKYPEIAPVSDLVTIDVAYDRTELTVDETILVKVTVSLNQPGGVAESAIIDLGLPPGFSLLSEDLAAQVARYNDVPLDYEFARIERFETTPRQIIIYLTNLSQWQAAGVQLPPAGQVPAAGAGPGQQCL